VFLSVEAVHFWSVIKQAFLFGRGLGRVSVSNILEFFCHVQDYRHHVGLPQNRPRAHPLQHPQGSQARPSGGSCDARKHTYARTQQTKWAASQAYFVFVLWHSHESVCVTTSLMTDTAGGERRTAGLAAAAAAAAAAPTKTKKGSHICSKHITHLNLAQTFHSTPAAARTHARRPRAARARTTT
jgi:hypothetical protein